MPIKVMHLGLGPIGCAVVSQVSKREGFQIAGAVDTDPRKVGQDLGEVAGLGRPLGVQVIGDLAAALDETKPDIVVHCTSSSLQKVLPDLELIIRARIPLVSTTEELMYPWYSNRDLATRIDQLARSAGVAVLGTGVNPGFAMDTIPITLTGVCERVDSITVNRIQDARIRRLPFQVKIGSGLTPEQFQERVENKTVRHVGLTESVAMIADAMGWDLEKVTDEIQPKIAEAEIQSAFLTVKPGQVCGLVQDGIGYSGGKALITLHMEAYLGSPETYDSVLIEGTPRLCMKVEGGFHGDISTASITVNSIPKVIAAQPGLRTMRDMPIPSFFRRSGG